MKLRCINCENNNNCKWYKELIRKIEWNKKCELKYKEVK